MPKPAKLPIEKCAGCFWLSSCGTWCAHERYSGYTTHQRCGGIAYRLREP